MPMSRYLSLLYYNLGLSLVLPMSASAGVLITGSVLDSETKRPPAVTTKVRAYDGDTPRSEFVPSDALGRFSVALPNVSPGANTKVKLVLEAPGYEQFRRTIDIRRPNITLPQPLPLKRKAGIRLLTAALSESGRGDKLVIDFTLENSNSAEAVDIQALQISGTSAPQKNCIDGGPAMTYTISDELKETGAREEGGVTVEGEARILAPDGKTLATRKLQGKFHHRSCGISEESLDVSYVFTLKPAERPPKLGLELPKTFNLRGKKANANPERIPWSPRKLTLVMSSGLTTELPITQLQAGR